MTDYAKLIGEDYEALYAPYMEDPGYLLRCSPIEVTPETRLLDMCSGSGAIVSAALAQGIKPYHIFAIEPSSYMRFHLENTKSTIGQVFPYHVEDAYLNKVLSGFRVNLVTCRQAVNYWWSLDMLYRVIGWMSRKNSAFIFDTFNTKPDAVPQTKQYIYKNHQFAEITCCTAGIVHHVQACEGLPMHITTFPWISPSLFELDLNTAMKEKKLSTWTRERNETTDTYVCQP